MGLLEQGEDSGDPVDVGVERGGGGLEAFCLALGDVRDGRHEQVGARREVMQERTA